MCKHDFTCLGASPSYVLKYALQSRKDQLKLSEDTAEDVKKNDPQNLFEIMYAQEGKMSNMSVICGWYTLSLIVQVVFAGAFIIGTILSKWHPKSRDSSSA